jgi:hypothetical protein
MNTPSNHKVRCPAEKMPGRAARRHRRKSYYNASSPTRKINSVQRAGGVQGRAALITLAIAQIFETSRNPWPHIEAMIADEIEDAARQRADEIRHLDDDEDSRRGHPAT